MSRYIDADKLKKHYSWWQGGTLAKTLDEMKRDFDTIVDLQPTVEAEPIKHGKWEVVYYDNIPTLAYCSRCDQMLRLTRETEKTPNYCPNCGADMRGGENG